MIDFNSTTPRGCKHTKSQVWCTPNYIIERLGGRESFDLDPCQSDNIVTKTAKNYFFERDDGLSKEWFGRVFCNPPYNNLKSWFSKMSKHNDGIVLCFARTDTKAWNYIETATGINFIRGRIKFLDENGVGNSPANAASCLIAWGEYNYMMIKNIPGLYVRIDKESSLDLGGIEHI